MVSYVEFTRWRCIFPPLSNVVFPPFWNMTFCKVKSTIWLDQLVPWRLLYIQCKNQLSIRCRNKNNLKNTRNTCNPMGDFLASSDLNIGHSDLNPCTLVDLRETNKTTAETLWLSAPRRFVPQFQFGKVNLQMAVVTLRNGSRSNGWCGIKVMSGRIIWHIEKNLVAKRL